MNTEEKEDEREGGKRDTTIDTIGLLSRRRVAGDSLHDKAAFTTRLLDDPGGATAKQKEILVSAFRPMMIKMYQGVYQII